MRVPRDEMLGLLAKAAGISHSSTPLRPKDCLYGLGGPGLDMGLDSDPIAGSESIFVLRPHLVLTIIISALRLVTDRGICRRAGGDDRVSNVDFTALAR